MRRKKQMTACLLSFCFVAWIDSCKRGISGKESQPKH